MNVRTAPLTHEAVKGLKEGHAVFTMPKGVIKCPGAGQKVSEDLAVVLAGCQVVQCAVYGRVHLIMLPRRSVVCHPGVAITKALHAITKPFEILASEALVRSFAHTHRLCASVCTTISCGRCAT